MLRGVFLARPNRFLAVVRVGRGEVEAHVPDRGRCLDLLVPGQRVVLVRIPVPAARRTQHTALLAEAKSAPGTWVCLDPAGAPRLVAAALEAGLIPSLRGLSVLRCEVVLPRRAGVASRIDLLLGARDAQPMLCEVKSVGAARGGVALFPDAPTLRGARHLRQLAARARRGLRTAVVFCAQRGDVRAVCADAQIDPLFALELRRAARAGVLLVGLRCAAESAGMRVLGEVPIALTAPPEPAGRSMSTVVVAPGSVGAGLAGRAGAGVPRSDGRSAIAVLYSLVLRCP